MKKKTPSNKMNSRKSFAQRLEKQGLSSMKNKTN